jgi:ribosome biogenesis protein UTP30
VENVPGGWDNVQSFHIKTNSSVSLPIWTCELDDSQGGRWGGLNVSELVNDEADSYQDVEDVPGPVADKKGKGKRAIDSESQRPKDAKRAKEIPATRPTPSVSLGSSPDVPSKAKKERRQRRPRMHTDDASPDSVKADATVIASVAVKGTSKITPAHPPSAPDKSGSSAAPSKNTKKAATKEVGSKPLTSEDLKQKRSTEKGERKKAKVLKGTKGKSAKEEVLGKKGRQAGMVN